MRNVRLRERALAEQTLFALSDEELLARVLDDDFPLRETAHQILATLGLGGLARALVNCPMTLQRFGLTDRQISRLKGAYDVMSHCNVADYLSKTQIVDSTHAAALFQAQMMHLDHEEVHILVLDTSQHVVEYKKLYQGTVMGAEVRLAEVVRPAILHNCPYLLIAHNHPSAEVEPSFADIEFTEALVAASTLLNLELLDHLIIGNPNYLSLKQRLCWR